MFGFTCKKIKSAPLRRKIKIDKDDNACAGKNILPKSYLTRNDGLYEIKLEEMEQDLVNYLYKYDIQANFIMQDETFEEGQPPLLKVTFYNIKILSKYAKKIKIFNISCMQQVIEKSLFELFLYLRENFYLSMTLYVLKRIGAFNMKYKPKNIVHKPFKIEPSLIEDVISNEMMDAEIDFDEMEELLKNENIHGIISFFSYIVLFTLDELKEIFKQYDAIEIHGDILHHYIGFYIKRKYIEGKLSFIWENDFDLGYWIDKTNVSLIVGNDKHEKKLEDFVKEFFVNKLKQYIGDNPGLVFALEMAVLHGISLFILNYINHFIDWGVLLQHHLSPKTITLYIKEQNQALEISDKKKNFTFEKYNTKFFEKDLIKLNDLNYYELIAFFLESGKISQKIIDTNSFEKNIFIKEDNFLFALGRSPVEPKSTSKPMLFNVWTYSKIDNILFTLDLLLGGHYNKGFLYRIAVTFLETILK